MAFCKFSSEYVAKTYTIIDNIFFTRFLPSTPPKLCSVYLYGLYLCSNNELNNQNSIENFANSLGFTVDEVLEAFRYWEEHGLIRIVSTEPVQIQYMPLRDVSSATRKYSKDKYGQFNINAQNIIAERQITPNEYEEYYCLMEGFTLPDGRRFSPEALLMIMKYCADYKGKNVNYRYILTVARNWANEGVISVENIEEKLESFSTINSALALINKALKTSKKTSLDEHQMYSKWIQEFGFNDEVILEVAKTIKVGGYEHLDKVLQKYFEMRLLSTKEIRNYENNKIALFNLAKKINKFIGVYYEDVENEVQTYITPWLNKGYSPECLLEISKFCYLKDRRTLSNLNDFIDKIYNIGIVSIDAFYQYIERNNILDKQMAEILSQCGLKRNVNNQDIDLFKRWTVAWDMPLDIINYGATLSQDKSAPLAYLSKILANWHSLGIKTVEEAKKTAETNTKTKNDPSLLKTKEYTNEDLDALLDAFKEIEI